MSSDDRDQIEGFAHHGATGHRAAWLKHPIRKPMESYRQVRGNRRPLAQPEFPMNRVTGPRVQLTDGRQVPLHKLLSLAGRGHFAALLRRSLFAEAQELVARFSTRRDSFWTPRSG